MANREQATGRTGRLGLLAVLLGLVGAASITPWLPAAARAVVMEGFAPFCHQLPMRSPHLHGVALAVCHRCYGIYWGLPLAVVIAPLLRPWSAWLYRNAPYVLLGSIVPAGIDWVVGISGLWSNVPSSRLITGLFFGLAAGYYLLQAVLGSVRTAAPVQA